MRNLNYLFIVLSLCFLFSSCEDNSENSISPNNPDDEENMEAVPGAILQGSFRGASGHSTTGVASVARAEDGSRTLTLNNFRTDSGPDLRIYLAEDTRANNFVEISDEVENGTNTYSIPNSVDLEKQNVVLIWCRAFSVNFGFTELTEPPTEEE